jgi:hypothetical protein
MNSEISSHDKSTLNYISLPDVTKQAASSHINNYHWILFVLPLYNESEKFITEQQNSPLNSIPKKKKD